jgi:hypothetical protein
MFSPKDNARKVGDGLGNREIPFREMQCHACLDDRPK